MNDLETAVIEAARRLFSSLLPDRSARVATLRAAVQAYEDSLIADAVDGLSQEDKFFQALDVSGRATRIKNALRNERLGPADLAGMRFVEIFDTPNLGSLSIPAILAALHFAGYDTVAKFPEDTEGPSAVEYRRLSKLMQEGGESGN